MQKVLLSVAAAAALSFASFAANAATHDGAFVSVTAGGSHYDVSGSSAYDKNDSSVGGLVGYRWVVDRPFSIGVEAGYVNLGKMTYSDTATYGSSDQYSDTIKAKFKGKAVLVGASGKWDLPNGFTITAHAGVAHSQIDLSAREYVDGPGVSRTYKLYDGTSHDNAIYAGLGFGYDFNEHFGISVVYDHYALKAEDLTGKHTVNVGVFGGNVEYRF
ncbi:autotransporter outer membrane beta-barrel domain-containing protein [Luteibacter aegosomaticola]|uniref:outer membrane protein n=1 Tax=Luteibacter aegosomaticola TaxID=2911538 RepID=UPI001FFADA6E|nr:outer membrane beta-barrel protein [Luteibacter aegosomaticola]UPG89867.1 autotransporter outer membrane beta-barrel domain-containing protein [Luteibacter aegosomaticola]